MNPVVDASIRGIWTAVGILWGVTALSAKRAAKVESGRSRFAHLAVMSVALALLFWSKLQMGVLAWRVLPASDGWALAGLALTVAGAALALWARFQLGGNWSGSVTIKQGHTLVSSGPYAAVRHPIYSGLLLAALGTAIARGTLSGFVGFTIAFVGWLVKSRHEESVLSGEFGSEYEQYRRRVRALIPFVL